MNIFDPHIIGELYQHYNLFFILAVLACAFGITFYLIPKVLWIVKEKKLVNYIEIKGIILFLISCRKKIIENEQSELEEQCLLQYCLMTISEGRRLHLDGPILAFKASETSSKSTKLNLV